MPPRRPLFAANWKMYKTRPQARDFVRALPAATREEAAADQVICPPFTALETLGAALGGTRLALGAQNLDWHEEGAFTGEIAPAMLADLGVTYVVIGHSERRQSFAETDDGVNKKIHAALQHHLIPIICVGERLDQRAAGETDNFVTRQILLAIAGLSPEQLAGLVFAYEPIWAIGTGKTCAADEADRVCRLIRERVTGQGGADAGARARVLYGGSVKPDTIAEQMAQPDIDGALVGGASLEPTSWSQLVANGLGVRV